MDYHELSDLALLELCVWREARGEPAEGQRGVAHVIRNRTMTPAWWNGHIMGSVARVVLQPYQFSSFNAGDPNADKWPDDEGSNSFSDVCHVVTPVWLGADPDNTAAATHYYDTSISFPKAWGPESNWLNTLNVGKLRFFKLKPLPPSNAGDVGTALAAT